jgi:DNA-binding IclR family transcriptional regulator
LVRAIARALTLLRAFTSNRPRLTLTEHAQIANLDKGTTRRLLHTLAVSGFIRFDEATQHYMLDAGVFEMASAVQIGRDLREIASPILAEVTAQTSAAAFLWVPRDGAALCLDRVRAPMLQIDAAWFAVGALAPLNCGAGPRIVLAHVSDEEREQGLSRELPQRTPFSETSVIKLRKAVEAIRRRGWELAKDDFFVGLAALGVPVFDRDGGFVAALSTTGLTADIVADGKPRHLETLQCAAERIGARLRL